MGVLSALASPALDSQGILSVLQSLVGKRQLCVRRRALHFPLLNPPVFPSTQTCTLLKPMDAQCLSPAESLPLLPGSAGL